MHTRLMGISMAYIVTFSLLMGISGLATFPPEPLTYDYPVYLQDMTGESSLTLSWESVIAVIIAFTLIIIVALNLATIKIFSSGFEFDTKFLTRLILGLGLAGAVTSTMIFMVQDVIPSWVHLFITYLPAILLVYSIVSEGD